jgi:23S rRNA (cytidine1920-2'-O)/16S rRNA (cytidine1409-2'-O)-methyltransferase
LLTSTRSDVARRSRLDAELVRRGLARSRGEAAELVTQGRVVVGGQVAAKPATAVGADTPVLLRQDDGPRYVSRGAVKLSGALDRFGFDVAGLRCLDAGASTGGFTDVLLRRGAAHVVAVDVGYGQLAWSLRTDRRVTVLDRRNVRSLTVDDIGAPAQVVVADLSFISLRLVLPALRVCATDDADYALLVKPQFEAGREAVGAHGVVRDPDIRVAAVLSVAEAAHDIGLGTAAVVASTLPGPAGNVEYFLWLRADAGAVDEADVRRAVEAGPS